MSRRLVLVALTALAALPVAARATAPTLVQVGAFATPTFVTAPPLDLSWIYVTERAGTIRVVKDGVKQPTPFLDITGLVAPTVGERGLLSMAFAPDYATSGHFYVYYTAATPLGAIQIDQFTRSAANPDVADPASRRPILTIPHSQQANHNGGQLAFGPDGMLYAGTGDGGGAGDPYRNGQNPATELGKMLRIDVSGGTAAAPPDNPYVRGGGDPLVWSIGLRNPYRFSFDRQTGDLVIGDVGQDTIEEVDYVTKAAGLGRGGNYGWSLVEGDLNFNQGTLGTAAASFPPNYIGPVVTHDHATQGWHSITGGYVLRDPALPELAGRYLYSDYAKGVIYSFAPSDPAGTDAPVAGLPKVNQPVSFGEDGCGRLYVVSLQGPVYRLATSGACAGPAPVPFPASPLPPPGSATGPTAGVGGPGGGVIDRRAPLLSVLAAVRQHALRGYLTVSAGCDDQCAVRATGKLNLSGGPRKGGHAVPRLTIKPVRRNLAAGARVRLRLPLTRSTRTAIRAALASGRAAFATISVVATEGAGNAKTTQVRVRILR